MGCGTRFNIKQKKGDASRLKPLMAGDETSPFLPLSTTVPKPRSCGADGDGSDAVKVKGAADTVLKLDPDLRYEHSIA